MIKARTGTLKILGCSVSVLALAGAAPAWAQESERAEFADVVEADGECAVDASGAPIATDPDCERIDAPTATTSEGGAIVVTGSRVKRPTYSSISPLQVITTEASQDAGLFDTSQILQRDEAATGQQIDSTFNGFVLDNGPGQQTLNLRGLGPERTLILINGRRVAPSGVEGAPSAPSINLLPSSLVERFDLLLDGASSVYGSDAVAGVTNIILRKDFDGLELFASGNLNPMGGGDDYQVSASYGLNLDRGFIGIGAEYNYRDEIRFSDRDFLSGCDTAYEVTGDGRILRTNLDDQINALVASNGAITNNTSQCTRVGYGLSGSIIEEFGNFGVLYFTPGTSNTGVPNFSESTFRNGRPVDANGDGFQDIDFADYSTNGAFPDGLFIPAEHRYNVMAYGEYTLPGAANITPFFEALYSRVDITATDVGISQIAPRVPDDNQFNPCNPFQPNGADCFNRGRIFNGQAPINFGIPVALPTVARVGIIGDRDNFDTTIEQYRGVLGVRGDMPFVGPSWTFEASGVYQRSVGTSRRIGVREDKLAFAIGIDPTQDFNGDGIVDNTSDSNRDGVADRPGDGIADDYDPGVSFGTSPLTGLDPSITPCDASALANPNLAAPDLLAGCVPVNLYAASLLSGARGNFASAAERDYLFGVRDFDTTYEQLTFSGFVTGDLFQLPAGPVGAVIGVEWREDKIDSRPDFTASNGLLYGFFSDQGAVGSKWIREAFAELDVPLLANSPVARELNLNLAGRVTDEEFYGTNFTYSGKVNWRPIDPLLFRFTYGTSFRAPNLRENFLLGQSGFLTVTDPCAIPSAAFVSGAYVPALDVRDPNTLANCIREGRDPTAIGISTTGTQVFQTSSVEIARVGSLALQPEESRSITAGATFEEKFGDGWGIALAATYYDIKIEDSIIEPSLQFAVNDCFTRQDGVRSPFCDNIFPGQAPSDLGLITAADINFINIDTNRVRGIDFNFDLDKAVTLFGHNVDLGINMRANKLIERSTLFVDSFGVANFDDDAGEFGLPTWTGRTTFTADVDNWTFTWQIRYLGDMRQQADGVDPLSDFFGNGPDGQPTGFFGNTCTGFGSNGPNGAANPIIPGDGTFCRDVGYADDYFEHAASIRYRTDVWEARIGVTNIFDRDPPNVDPNEVFSISNVPIGAGYNLDGREFFATMKYKF